MVSLETGIGSVYAPISVQIQMVGPEALQRTDLTPGARPVQPNQDRGVEDQESAKGGPEGS